MNGFQLRSEWERLKFPIQFRQPVKRNLKCDYRPGTHIDASQKDKDSSGCWKVIIKGNIAVCWSADQSKSGVAM